MTETTQAQDAGYDAQFATMTTDQLWQALLAVEAEYGRRQDAWATAHARVREISEDIDPHRMLTKEWDEAYADMLGAAAAATEQGKLVSAVNRVLATRCTELVRTHIRPFDHADA